MSWTCKMIEYHKGLHTKGGGIETGDMFWGPKPDELDDPKWSATVRFVCRHLSAYYLQNNSHRSPLVVCLPSGDLFCVDGMCWSSGNYYGGWKVSGDAPHITVEPSINMQGIYHGYLQQGIITDDCEGRQF
jgi:hypothetical protein